MSKAVKSVKKGVKKAWSAVKKIAPYVLAAVAVYFTAGVALSYFSATSAFAASMPGFGAGGMFTKAATAMGLSGPASAAAASSASAMAATGASVAGAAMPGSGAAAMGGTAASPAFVASGGSVAATGAGAAGTSGAVVSAGQHVGGEATTKAATEMVKEGAAQQAVSGAGKSAAAGASKKSGMSAAEKLLIAKTVTDTASGLMAKSPRDPMETFWGYNRKGEGMDLIQGDDRQLPPGPQRQSPEEHYKQATGEFMPPTQQQHAQRSQRTYETGYRDTRPDEE